MSVKDALPDLAAAVERWLSIRPGRTPEKIAELAGISNTTVRYMFDEGRLPRVSSILAVCDVVMSTEERISFLCKHLPKIGKQMVAMQDSRLMPENSTSAKVRHFLKKEVHSRVFNMAATYGGTTYEDVTRIAGELGAEALDEMLSADVLVRKESRIKFHNERWAIPNLDDALEQVAMSVKHFNKDLVGTDGATLCHLTGSIKKSKMPELAEHIRSFIAQTNDMREDEDFKGADNTFFLDIIYSLYDSKGDEQ